MVIFVLDSISNKSSMNMVYRFYILTLILVLTFTSGYSVPAKPKPMNVLQSDGTSITILRKGDESYNYTTTLDGYMIKADAGGVYRYVISNCNDSLVISGVKANDSAFRSDLENNFLKSQTKAGSLLRKGRMPTKAMKIRQAYKAPRKQIQGSTNIKGIVFLIQFSDVKFSIPNPSAAFSDMLNVPAYSNTYGQIGSATDYFKDNSMLALNTSFVVVGPITVNRTMKYYGANNAAGDDKYAAQALVDACAIGKNTGAFSSLDFNQFDTNNDGYIDNLFFFFAGYNEAEGGAANAIWPHAWNMSSAIQENVISTIPMLGTKIVENYACSSEFKGSSGGVMAGIGTFCHEFSHVLGLPDIYDTDYEESGGDGYGLDEWSIMSFGAYNNNGNTPAGYTSYERYAMGWLTPTELSAYGNYTLDQISTSNKAYIIKTPKSDEYFLLENRQKNGWDKYLNGHGLLILHIDYLQSAWNDNTLNVDPSHQRITLVPGDNNLYNTLEGLIGDPYPGSTNNTSLTDSSTPAANLWTNSKLGKPIRNISETNDIISFKFLNPPSPITIKAEAILSSGFTAKWNASNGAVSYNLEIYTINPTTSEKTGVLLQKNILSTGYNVTGLAANTEYRYVVRSVDAGGNESSNSNEIILKTSLTNGVDNSETTKLKIYAFNGQLIVESKLQGKHICVYNVIGKLIKDVIVTNQNMSIPLDKGQIYIIIAYDKILKVAM